MLDPKTPPGKPQSMPVPSPYWGDEAVLVRPGHHQSRGDGQQGPRLDVGAVPSCPRTSRRSASDHPSAALAPHAEQLPADSVLRPEDAAVQAGRHLLRHASRAVRDRCDETLYGNGPFSGAIGWVNTREARRDRRCRRRARLVSPVVSTSIRTGRSIRAVDRAIRGRRVLQRHSASRTAASGAPCPGRCRARSFASIRRRASAKRTSRPSIRPPASSATRRAASTSIRTA